MIATGYKVIDQGHSVHIHHWSRVHYEPDYLSQPAEGSGPLTVFTNLEAVKKYIYGYRTKTIQIFKCEYQEHVGDFVWTGFSDKTSKKLIALACCPTSTLTIKEEDVAFADWVILREEISLEEK